MAYDRKKIFEQAKKAITENKLIFIEDIVGWLSLHPTPMETLHGHTDFLRRAYAEPSRSLRTSLSAIRGLSFTVLMKRQYIGRTGLNITG